MISILLLEGKGEWEGMIEGKFIEDGNVWYFFEL
jgi:hypothetical protein